MDASPFDRVVVSFCEGQHDVAFISRLLLVDGFVVYNKKIKEFPEPFSDRFKTELGNIGIPDKMLGFQAPSALLPSIALNKGRVWVFLHNVGGDSKHETRNALVKMYRDLSAPDDYSFIIPYRFLYFFDSDNIGVNSRVASVAQEIGMNPEVNLQNGNIVFFDEVQWGTYIFHNSEDQLGTLENLILGYFANKIPNLHSSIIAFLRANAIPGSSTRKMKFNNGAEVYYGQSRYAENKSIIGVYGQLQFSGMSNSSLLENTDFMKAADFLGCNHCQAIKGLFA
ncbi:hypothetical protein QM574_20195 [Pantoea ananatis]|uniref:hypothetical protein n=1 Tax=Pantoea ananas TaxID=553 RepID=UPI0024B72868|nr:hypothetical protein [Pantoea ananatis]MDJ0046876.1 hypothetical protein [Pantoea ananatis]